MNNGELIDLGEELVSLIQDIDWDIIKQIRKDDIEDDLKNKDQFDVGILNDHGGGNVDWWHNYIRSLLDEAHTHYTEY